MRKRRTKAEMQQARYNEMVDGYKFFIWCNIEERFKTGYEHKSDAQEILEDFEDGKIYTFRTAVTAGLGDALNKSITYWKTV